MMVLCRFCNAHFNGRAAYIFHLGQKKHKSALKARASIRHSEEDGSPVPADGAASAKFVSNGVGEGEAVLPDPPPVPAAPSSTVFGSRWYGLSDVTSDVDLPEIDSSWCRLSDVTSNIYFP